MTPVELQNAIIAQAQTIAATVATSAGLPSNSSQPIADGAYTATGFLDPKVRYTCSILVGDPDPELPND